MKFLAFGATTTFGPRFANFLLLTGKFLGLTATTPNRRQIGRERSRLPFLQHGIFLLAVVGMIGFSSCDLNHLGSFIDPQSTADGTDFDPASNGGWPADSTVTADRNPVSSQQPSALVIGSFNIQTFGRSKMSKPEVIKVLVDIAHRFDILAIQELRDKSEETIPEFLKQVNRHGAKYAAAVSRRIGYADQRNGTSYEEQLVYLYDTTRVRIEGTPYVANDRYQLMHRPPYVAQFRCLDLPPDEAFSFVLLNVHIDPDDTVAEFAALQDIIGSVFPNHPQEDDFILIGDLNDNAKGFQQVRWFDSQFATIPSHWNTNTRMNKSYDNIVFDSNRTAEFLNMAGVLDLHREYQLTREKALEVSDHMPVWAVFSTREAPSNRITQSPSVIR